MIQSGKLARVDQCLLSEVDHTVGAENPQGIDRGYGIASGFEIAAAVRMEGDADFTAAVQDIVEFLNGLLIGRGYFHGIVGFV